MLPLNVLPRPARDRREGSQAHRLAPFVRPPARLPRHPCLPALAKVAQLLSEAPGGSLSRVGRVCLPLTSRARAGGAEDIGRRRDLLLLGGLARRLACAAKAEGEKRLLAFLDWGGATGREAAN